MVREMWKGDKLMIMSIVTRADEDVFSSWRNVDKDVAARTDAGKRFQVLGAATGKARPPNDDLCVDDERGHVRWTQTLTTGDIDGATKTVGQVWRRRTIKTPECQNT